MLFSDSVLLVSILLVSFSIRLGYWYLPGSDLAWVIFGAPVIASIIFVRFGLYRAVIRYVGFKALWSVVQAVSLYALVWGVVGFMAAVDGIPRSVILINWVLSLLAIGGLRVMARWLLTGNKNSKGSDACVDCKKVLVYGAGEAGVQLASALSLSPECEPVGFIDDLKELQGSHIAGLDVHSVDDIEDVISKLKVDEVLIAMPSTSRSRRLDIVNALEPYPVMVRMLPGISELAEGKISINDLREPNIKDLLGRDVASSNQDLLSKNITDKVVVVTV